MTRVFTESAAMPRFESLTVLFPMWNEESYARQAVRAALESCERLRASGEIGTYEVLVVDDASTDRTGDILRELARDDPRVRVVHHRENRRLGGALKTGFREARGELVAYSDADLPFDLCELDRACRFLHTYRAHMVSAYRHDRTSEGMRRSVYSFAYNWLIRGVFGLRLRDVNFAFKVFRRDILAHATPQSEGSFVDAEFLVRSQRLGFKVIQFGVDYFPRTRGISTLSNAETIRGILRELVAHRAELLAIRALPAAALRLPTTEGDA